MPLALTPTTRRILQAVLYEAIAITAVGPAMAWLFDAPMASSLALALLLSSVALAWNWAFNTLFERWEARQTIKGRSWRRRLAHGIGFEGGLVVMLVPLMAWWLNTTLWAALLADLGIVAFFFVYAVAFTWAFDRIVGLPESARANPGPPHAEHA